MGDPGETAEPLVVRCMECKAQRPYTVERFDGGNEGWRCTVCGKIMRLVPGNYSVFYGLKDLPC